jgi:hypothetical protein
MTPTAAKKIMAAAMSERGLSFDKLTARTVGFSDLARGQAIFVKVHGWKPNPAWDELRAIAAENGFRIEAAGGISG